ncbi:hypothetical protein REPUB_Repub09cG0030100 [Reevesia pubescens]
MAIVIAAILLFLGVGMVVIIHVCIVGRAFWRGIGNPGRFDRSNSSNRTMSKDDLQKLPCYDYIAKDNGSSSPVDCAVCLENFKTGEKCRLLPQCRHSFHAECVDSWLLRNPICPICRTSADSSSHLDDVSIEVRDNQIREASNVIDNGNGATENQTNLVGIHSSFAIETTTATS